MKKADKEARKRRETDAFLKLTALEDAQALQDQEEINYMERTTRLGYKASSIDADDSANDGDAPMEIDTQRYGADDDDFEGIDSPSAYQPSDGDRSRDEEDEEDDEEEEDEGEEEAEELQVVDSDDGIGGQPSAKIKVFPHQPHLPVRNQRGRYDLIPHI